MSLGRLLSKSITLRYDMPGGEDDYGQPVPVPFEVSGLGYYQLAGVQDMDDVSRDQKELTVYLPVSTEVTYLKSVVINGEELQLDGPPHKQYNPRVASDAYWKLSVRRAK